MKIKAISATALKGCSFSHQLSKLVLFVGDNATGKSARLDAIRLGLMGYLPELGKTAQATAQLGTDGNLLSVRVDAEDGQSITRSWNQSNDSCRATELGSLSETPPVLIDPSLYLNLPEKQRVKFIFGMMDMEQSEWNGEHLVQTLKAIPTTTDQDQAVLEQLVKDIDASDYVRHEGGVSVQDWIEELIETHKKKVSETNDSKSRMEKFAQGMVELKAADTEQSLAVRYGELESVRKQHGELLIERGILMEKMQQAQYKETEARRLKEFLATTEDLPAQLEAAIAKMKLLATESLRWTDNIDAIRVELSNLEPKLFEQRARLTACNRGIKQYDWEKAETLQNERCPCCNSKSKAWKETFSDKMDEKLATLKAEQANANAIVTKFTHEIEDCKRRLLAAEAEEKQARNIELQLREARTDAEIRLPMKIEERENAKKRLGELTVTSFDREAVKAVDGKVESLAKQIADMATLHNQAVARMAENKRVEESRLKLIETTRMLGVLKAIVAKLQWIQGEMVTWAFGSILKTANRVLGVESKAPLIKTPLAYHQGELGRFDGSQWVSHKTFSGMEKKLVYVALSAALADKAPFKIILMDEMGVMGRSRRIEFLAQMAHLIEEKVIDQFIGIDTDAELYDGCGLKLALIPVG